MLGLGLGSTGDGLGLGNAGDGLGLGRKIGGIGDASGGGTAWHIMWQQQ
jgi:hypothetical protein